MNPRAYYTNRLEILYELIHQLRYRELFFLPYKEDVDGKLKSKLPIRWMNAQYINMLKRHWKEYGFFHKKMNIYGSLAHYRDFPMFSYDWTVKAQQQKLWLKRFHNHVKGYDSFLETDSPSIGEAWADAREIKKFYDEFLISYSLRFSGSKGFHFIVRYQDFAHLPVKIFDKKFMEKTILQIMSELPLKFDELFKSLDLVTLFKLIAIKLKGVLGADTMDTAVQDVKRVVKLAYSLDVKSGLIAYPLDDEMFLNFQKDDLKPANVLRIYKRERGLLFRHNEMDYQIRQRRVDKMLKYLKILS